MKGLRKTRKTSVRIAGVRVEILIDWIVKQRKRDGLGMNGLGAMDV
jgi:hypothetical protein